jgi:hypothetical protein
MKRDLYAKPLTILKKWTLKDLKLHVGICWTLKLHVTHF